MTPTTMMTTLDVISPTEPSSNFTSLDLITPSDPTTSSSAQNNNTNGNVEASGNSQALVPCTNANTEGNSNDNNNSYYGLRINVISDVLFSCFRPTFWSGNARTKPTTSVTQDDREIAFESIKTLDFIDAGSQAAVFSGEYNGQLVAVKKVKKLEEVQSVRNLMNLKHDNIIKFIGVCTQAPCYCIIMELCEKGTLSTLLKSEDIISRGDWVRWLKEIAEGMLYLHDNKVIHRDLKSPNLLVSNNNQIKICDFGTSQVRQDMKSMVMSFCGTVSWMAPEVIRKQSCCEKVDVYSFGVVFWEMLTREKPYKNIEPMTIMYNVGRKKLSLPIPSLASEGAKILLKQTLSENPRNRPSFRNILYQIGILEFELKKFNDESWHEHHSKMRREAEAYEYPVETAREPETSKKAAELERSRRKVLKHAEEIRNMYENRYQRVTEMMSMLNQCHQKLIDREEGLNKWELELLHHQRTMEARYPGTKSIVIRAGPQALRGAKQDISSSIIPSAASYGPNGYDSSSSAEDMNDFADFSRQSSYRSSAGRLKTERDPSFSFMNRDTRAFSEQHHVDNLVRGCSARNSGYSVDSGVNLNCSLSVLNLSNQGISYPMVRHVDGRASDSKLSAKRRSHPDKCRRSESYQSSYRSKERSAKHSSIRRMKVMEQTASTSKTISDDDKNQNNQSGLNQLKTDASSENSDEDYVESNGNKVKNSFKPAVRSSMSGRVSSNDDPNDDRNDEVNILTSSNTSAMASSLERALEASDGLSDKEKVVRAASATIKGHRRCYSYPINNFSYPMDEISADSEDEVDV
ncbi:unnamed protein product [Auanema sp. JU1783]|nr:unnamed protein product [Auanema sp. JU1783]